MNMGAGRVVYQSLTRIDKDIAEGKFAENTILNEALDKAVSEKLNGPLTRSSVARGNPLS